jgi:hypothetical protein
MPTRLIKIERRMGYELRVQELSGAEHGLSDGETLLLTSAFSLRGHYIGDEEMAKQLLKRGIQPEYRFPEASVCTVGFHPGEQKWYGWSHRGICGFGIGDQLFDVEYTDGVTDETPFIERGSKVIETLDEARQAASNFAEYVSA